MKLIRRGCELVTDVELLLGLTWLGKDDDDGNDGEDNGLGWLDQNMSKCNLELACIRCDNNACKRVGS